MNNIKIKIGVVADDFTGAADAASFLKKSGAKTILYTSTTEHTSQSCDAVVIALKTRSVSPKEAIKETQIAVDFLKDIGCEKIYFKYCSTFDSTPKGNIGPVSDYLMEYLDVPYTVLCPSLPINGRIVKDGTIYVNGVKLDESPLKNHPLNPMWDSYIPNLMKDQSKYPCIIMSQSELNSESVLENIARYKENYEKFYIVPDYISEQDAEVIAERFKELSFLTGGSGLLSHILLEKSDYCEKELKNKKQRSIILCGSCSAATKQQVHYYKNQGGLVYSVDADKLIDNSLTANTILEFIDKQTQTVLVYSDAIDKDMVELKKTTNFYMASSYIEKVMSDLSYESLTKGFNCIVVAGGETSGAVTQCLGYDSFIVGKSVDPGVPELIPLKNKEVTLVLKSGNFGAEDFFVKAAGVYTNE